MMHGQKKHQNRQKC